MSGGSRSTWLFAGGGVVLVAVLGLAAQLLPSLQLRFPIDVYAAIAIASAGFAVDRVRDINSRRTAAYALDATLDAALAGWPPRTAAHVSPYDLGVHPSAAQPRRAAGVRLSGNRPPSLPRYVQRRAERELNEALANGTVVVVHGPAGSGKSRSAYEAVRHRWHDAKLLVPENADGLRALLAHTDALPQAIGGPLVLWLDGLARYMPGLDVDQLDQLIAFGGLRAIVTIDDDELRGLMENDDADGLGRRTRRLLARARVARIPRPDATERAAAAAIAAAAAGSPPGPLLRRWRPADVPVVHAPKHPWRPSAWFVALAIAALGSGALVVVAVVNDDWQQPSDFAQQVKNLRRAADPCEQLAVSPTDPTALEPHDVLVVTAHRDGCPDSDRVRLYAARDSGKLHQLGADVRLPADPQRSFACLAPSTSDPCAVDDEDGHRILVGALSDPESQQQLPIAPYVTGDAVHVTALIPHIPRPSRALDASALRHDRAAVPLRFGATNAHGPCEASSGCVRDHAAYAWAAAQMENEPTVLLAGYLTRHSTPEAGGSVLVLAWHLRLDAQDVPTVGGRCRAFSGGRAIRLVVPVDSPRTADAQVASRWSAAVRPEHTDIVCEQDARSQPVRTG